MSSRAELRRAIALRRQRDMARDPLDVLSDYMVETNGYCPRCRIGRLIYNISGGPVLGGEYSLCACVACGLVLAAHYEPAHEAPRERQEPDARERALLGGARPG